MLRRAIFYPLVFMVASAAFAQVQPRVEDMRGPIEATPLDWKWKRLSGENVFWNYVRNRGGPLVISMPAAPSEGSSGIDDHMARLFHEEGYTIGILTWRDERARKQSANESIAAVASQFAQVRADPERFGGFDPDRIVVVGKGEDAFPAAFLAFSGNVWGNSAAKGPVCAAIFFDGMNFDPTAPDTLIAKKKFAEEADPIRFSSIRFAAGAPPTLLMTEALDRAAARRSDQLAAAIRAAGGTAVRTTYPKFAESDPTTFLGYSENPSTKVIEDFLRTYCPAKAAEH